MLTHGGPGPDLQSSDLGPGTRGDTGPVAGHPGTGLRTNPHPSLHSGTGMGKWFRLYADILDFQTQNKIAHFMSGQYQALFD